MAMQYLGFGTLNGLLPSFSDIYMFVFRSFFSGGGTKRMRSDVT